PLDRHRAVRAGEDRGCQVLDRARLTSAAGLVMSQAARTDTRQRPAERLLEQAHEPLDGVGVNCSKVDQVVSRVPKDGELLHFAELAGLSLLIAPLLCRFLGLQALLPTGVAAGILRREHG